MVSFFSTVGVNPIGVQLVTMGGRPSGEGFVQLGTQEDMRRGLVKHLHQLGGRQIEVLPSTTQEVVRALGYDTQPRAGGAAPGYGAAGRDFGQPSSSAAPPAASYYSGGGYDTGYGAAAAAAGRGQGGNVGGGFAGPAGYRAPGAPAGGYYGGDATGGMGGGYPGARGVPGDLNDPSRKRARF